MGPDLEKYVGAGCFGQADCFPCSAEGEISFGFRFNSILPAAKKIKSRVSTMRSKKKGERCQLLAHGDDDWLA